MEIGKPSVLLRTRWQSRSPIQLAFDINECIGKSGVEERTENDIRLPTSIERRLFELTQIRRL